MRLVIHFLLMSVILASCNSPAPSPEDIQRIDALRSELSQLRSEIASAETKNSSLAGGLVKAMVEARLEILKTTESLIQQRIHALESGAKITVQVAGTKVNEELAKQLQQELETQLADLKSAQDEAAKYSGGLVAAMKQATVATHEQTVAILRQRYLAAKYGLPTVLMPGSSSPTSATSENRALPNSSSTTSPTNLDIPGEVNSEILFVKLLRKQFAKQDYQDFIWFDIEFTAKGLDKPARAIKGVLNLQDLFGEPHMRINYTIDKPLKPGEKVIEKGTGFEYNQFRDEHQWVRATDIQNMTASFTVMNILYQDGSRQDF